MVSSPFNLLHLFKSNRPKPKDPAALRQEFQNSIPVTTVLMNNGFYAFDSELSYEIFKRRKGLEYMFLDGYGIPSFYITDDPRSLGRWKGDLPSYLIFKFVMIDFNKPGPSGDCRLEVERNGFCLYRVPFCEIYQRYETSSVDYIFSFPENQPTTRSITLSKSQKSLYSRLDNVGLRWRRCTAITGDRDDYTLRVSSTSPNEEENEPIVAHYTRANRDRFVTKWYRQATLYVGKKSSDILLHSTLWNVELITCQALFIHYHEYRKRAGWAKSNSYNPEPSGRWGPYLG